MKLSMWIIADWLKDFSPEINIREGDLQIETVRLFSSGFSVNENCMYIGRMSDLFVHGKNEVICTHKNDILILQTDDLDEILNQVLNAFDHYQNWNDRLTEAVSAGRRPADFLKIANEIIHEPLYLLDANQYAMALSEGYGPGSVNELWDQMLEKSTTDISFLQKLDTEYPEHRTRKGFYHFSVPFVKQNAYNYNMILDGQWIGLCSMVDINGQLPQHVIDLYRIFCSNLEIWFIANYREKEIHLIDSMFREALLDNNAISEAFIRQYHLRFHSQEGIKYILVLRTAVEESFLITHVCRELNLSFHDLLAVIHQEHICVIADFSSVKTNPELPASFLKDLSRLLKRTGYFGGYSLPFMDLKDINKHFHEALYTADNMNDTPGMIESFQNYSFNYALEEVRASIRADVIHPDVKRLIDYDRIHKTDFSNTLRTYLENERSQSKTAEILNLHRNTLTYRLQRIRQLIDSNTDDPDIRLHMILSFRFINI